MDLKSKLIKILPKLKPKTKTPTIELNTTTPKTATQEPTREPLEPTTEKPIKTYHETLYSRGTTPPKPKTKQSTKPLQSWKSTHWEGINSIEKNVDTIHTKEKTTHTTNRKETDIERKVDIILNKKHK